MYSTIRCLRLLGSRRSLQILIERLATDAEHTGQRSFLLACIDTPPQLSSQRSGERQPTPLIGPALLGQRGASRWRSLISARSNAANTPSRWPIASHDPVTLARSRAAVGRAGRRLVPARLSTPSLATEPALPSSSPGRRTQGHGSGRQSHHPRSAPRCRQSSHRCRGRR
jgi:hypothetical protein